MSQNDNVFLSSLFMMILSHAQLTVSKTFINKKCLRGKMQHEIKQNQYAPVIPNIFKQL